MKVGNKMNDGEWKYYNHAVISAVEPHEVPNLTRIKNKSIWKIKDGIPFLARWTTDYDCGYETGWWYVVKDTPFDITSLKAKRRYEIRKGKKYFEVKRINSSEYSEEMYNVLVYALESWPKKYRPNIKKEEFIKNIIKWDNDLVYGGFDKETNKLCGFAYLKEYSKHLEFNVLRVIPAMERRGINAAMVAGILEDNNEKLKGDFYINDGARSILHETAFQDYLEKYFGFRKAYCKLHVIYRFPLNICVKMLFPFRKFIKDTTKVGSIICAILKMEDFRRQCEK